MPPFAHAPGPGQITVTDAHDRLRAGGAVLLDVREADEYAAGHSPDAVWQPLAAVAAAADLPAQAQGLVVLAICRSGNRSGRAAEFLAARGVEVLNVSGGMRAWAAAGLPVRNSAGRAGRVV